MCLELVVHMLLHELIARLAKKEPCVRLLHLPMAAVSEAQNGFRERCSPFFNSFFSGHADGHRRGARARCRGGGHSEHLDDDAALR